MTKKNLSLIFVVIISSFFVSCKQDESVYTANLVNRFVYDGMSQYYLWSSEMKNKKPTSSDTSPYAYFDRILSANDRFSWITDDVEGLLADFSGTPLSFGFNFAFIQSPTSSTEYYAVIKYVFPNTPASKAGLKRVDYIGKINDQPITKSNYSALYEGNSLKFTMYKYINSTFVQDKEINISPEVINTNPVLCDTIYQIDNHKVGYLFYTDFIANYNGSLYSTFNKFKAEGITDLILDLRYNHGGGISAATYLSSLIAPASAVTNKSVFTILSYNAYLNNLFDDNGWSRKDSLGSYDKSKEQNPLNANLNLNKVYIIATKDSYSASELTAFCLKPFMNVVHIGENTGGKYVASFTIHPYNEDYGVPIYDEKSIKKASDKNILKNWALQPIVARYTNKNGVDFSNPGYLAPDYNLNEGSGHVTNWTQIGDTTDTYLAQAIWLIKGNTGIKPTSAFPLRAKTVFENSKELPNVKDLRKSSVIIDKQQLSKKYNEINKIWYYE